MSAPWVAGEVEENERRPREASSWIQNEVTECKPTTQISKVFGTFWLSKTGWTGVWLDVEGKYRVENCGSYWLVASVKTKYLEVRRLNNRNALPHSLGVCGQRDGRGLLQEGPAGDHCWLLMAPGLCCLSTDFPWLSPCGCL